MSLRKPIALGIAVGMLALAPACAGTERPRQDPVTQANLERASALVEQTVAARDDMRLVEAGLEADVFTWQTQERTEYDAVNWDDPEDPVGREREVQERVLMGPLPMVIEFEHVTGFNVHRWVRGAGLEILLDEAPDSAVLEMPDVESARELAAALDVLRRARAGVLLEEEVE